MKIGLPLVLFGLVISAKPDSHEVTMKRVGTTRHGALYIGTNPCRRVGGLERIRVRKVPGLGSVGFVRKKCRIGDCGDPRTTMTVKPGESLDGSTVKPSDYLVACIGGASPPKKFVIDVDCRAAG